MHYIHIKYMFVHAMFFVFAFFCFFFSNLSMKTPCDLHCPVCPLMDNERKSTLINKFVLQVL